MNVKEKIKNFVPAKDRVKIFFTKKRIIWGSIILAILIIIGIAVWGGSPSKSTVEVVTRGPLESTVLATGQVTSTTDLMLSFSASDVVRSIRATVGDKVVRGQTLATLDQKDELANLTQARGALLATTARFNKVQEGASTEEMRVAEVALENAKRDLEITKNQQSILVKNAYRALLNNDLTPTASGYSTSSVPTVTGLYDSTVEGSYEIYVYSSSSGSFFSLSGLESGVGPVSTTIAEPLGTRGLYIQFPSGFVAGGQKWLLSLPNKQGSNYVTLLNAYTSALETEKNAVSSAESLVFQRQAEFDLKRAGARSVELDAAYADVLSAQGRFESAQVALENTVLRAPVNGTVTRVDIKLGELVQAFTPAVGLQDTENLYLEANINEANISTIAQGQLIDVTFDAFGPDVHREAVITTVEPSSTLVSGVVNYRIKASIPKVENIKPGMTANMTILVDKRENVLQVPTRSIIEEDEKRIVRVVIDEKKGDFEEVEVITGLEGDGGMTEIISGITEGQKVIVLLNSAKK